MQVGVLLAVLARLYHAGPLQAAAVATRVHRELHRVDDQRRRAQVIDQLINQSINRSIDLSIYISIDQYFDQTRGRSMRGIQRRSLRQGGRLKLWSERDPRLREQERQA